MAKSPEKKSVIEFRNVGVIAEDHERLRELADAEQRSMARQLSVLIRQAHEQMMAQ